MAIDSNDRQGIRYLIGHEYLADGNVNKAEAYFEESIHEPGSRFGLAFLHIINGVEEKKLAFSLLQAFAGNRYIAPMILDEDYDFLDGTYGSPVYWAASMNSHEWAEEYYFKNYRMWEAEYPRTILSNWWNRVPVRSWRLALDESWQNPSRLKTLTNEKALKDLVTLCVV